MWRCHIWPRALFAFMSRHQQDLECLRKECKERFGCAQSGNCTHCGKYIQRDLGKHIAFYHMELAQLWRCPAMWCTVWKGTAQDSIDHMWQIHKVPLSVKAANLARFIPPWTVTREQWGDMTMPSISGVVIDTLLFSRIGSPLCHRYRIINRTGSHTAILICSHRTVSRSRRPPRLKGVSDSSGGPELGCPDVCVVGVPQPGFVLVMMIQRIWRNIVTCQLHCFVTQMRPVPVLILIRSSRMEISQRNQYQRTRDRSSGGAPVRRAVRSWGRLRTIESVSPLFRLSRGVQAGKSFQNSRWI